MARPPMSPIRKRNPLPYALPRTGPITLPARATRSWWPESWLGLSEAVRPPAIDVYRRKTARTAATDSAITSRTGLGVLESRATAQILSPETRGRDQASRVGAGRRGGTR